MSRLAVVGPGAIGLAVAAAVEATERHELVLCARRPVATTLVERSGEEPVHVRSPVLTDVATAAPVDWVLLAVKAHQTDGAGAWLSTLAGPSSTVVVLQNGVRHRDRVGPYVGAAAVVPTSVWIAAEPRDDRVVLRATNKIRVPDDEAGRAFAAILAGSWLEVETVADFQTESWRKLCVNAVAGLMVLAGRRAVIFRDPEVAELGRRLARECAAVARAEGALLADDEAVELCEILATVPPETGTSILFDRERDLALEWQARNGVIRELGREHGVATPVSDVIVPLLAAASR